MKLLRYILPLLLLAGAAPADDVVIFLKTVNYKSFVAVEEVDPPKALAPKNYTSTSKEYQVINMQANEMATIAFYGTGTTSSPKQFDVFDMGGVAFGSPSEGASYYVLPQKAGTTLWCGGFDYSVVMPGWLDTVMWRGVGTPLKLSTTRTVSSVPRTMEYSGIEAGEESDYDSETFEPMQPFGFYTDVITGSIALQEPLTKSASLGIAGEVRLKGDPQGEILVPGTLAYGIEMVRRLLKSQKYEEREPFSEEL